jgi:hypothetical protein
MPNKQQQQPTPTRAEQAEERSVSSALSQLASSFDTGAGLTLGGLAAKSAVDGLKSVANRRRQEQEKQ